MTPYWMVVAGGAALAAGGMLLRKPLAGRGAMPNWAATGIGGLALGLGLATGSMHALGYHWSSEFASLKFKPSLMPVSPGRANSIGRPLAPGSSVWPRAAGWLNVGADGPPDVANRVVVVDVWAEWCPFCPMAASGLIEIHRKCLERGVIFVTLTAESADTAKSMVEATGIPWPVGYGASEAMRALGGIAPTVFVIGRDGRIAWHDGQARYRHDIDNLAARVQQSIDETLAKNAVP